MGKSSLRMLRSQAVLVLVVVLGLAAAGAITLLQRDVSATRRAQAKVTTIELQLVNLENAPLSATQATGSAIAPARTKIETDSRSISAGLQSLIAGSAPPASLRRVQADVADADAIVGRVFEIGAGSRNPVVLRRELPAILVVVSALQVKATAALGLLAQAGRVYNQRANQARSVAIFGSVATILVLLVIFMLFYRRARVARAENVRLLEESQDEAITDPLTGIGNRRAFKRDLEQRLPGVNAGDELLVAMFDLDGFKLYNDTFGHGAGDALLARLAGFLKEAAAGSATAYRMGGDEFCLLGQVSHLDGERLVHSAVAALSDTGKGWYVGCSWGVAWMPSEASGGSEALRLADERMYTQKTSRVAADQQATAALVQVLVERDVELSTHISRVAHLALATARRLGVSERETTRTGLAAQLHDIGKTAIPESILAKPGPLDDEEWAFMRCHTLIGERIVAAAPSLAHTAELVRSSHERLDGQGYPDRLSGTEIPLGSRIIAVCDSFDAMVAPRRYRDPSSTADSIAELRRCSGTQFDPEVVDAFCAIALEHESVAATDSARRSKAAVVVGPQGAEPPAPGRP
jgi:diguanylate cyclase (GGDEF)-like protein